MKPKQREWCDCGNFVTATKLEGEQCVHCLKFKPPPKQREWDKELVEVMKRWDSDSINIDDIIEFILDLLQAQHQQTLEMIEGMKKGDFMPHDIDNYRKEGYNQALRDLKARLEGEK